MFVEIAVCGYVIKRVNKNIDIWYKSKEFWAKTLISSSAMIVIENLIIKIIPFII